MLSDRAGRSPHKAEEAAGTSDAQQERQPCKCIVTSYQIAQGMLCRKCEKDYGSRGLTPGEGLREPEGESHNMS